jgi:two-component system response regulator MprA
MARVAVCEDDRALRGLLRRALEGDGHSVVATAKGSDLLARLDPVPHVVILDIGLPDADGRDVCLALRAHGVDAPVLMLTALGGMHHKVSGFEAGADDYLTKPFDIPELLVRIRALLRRTTVAVTVDEVVLDPTSHEVRRGEAGAALTPTEFRLLGRLISVPGEPKLSQRPSRSLAEQSGSSRAPAMHSTLSPGSMPTVGSSTELLTPPWPGSSTSWADPAETSS